MTLARLPAAICALALSAGVPFHDITQGDNTLRLDVASTDLVVAGYDAGPGWDPVSGLGSPKATDLAATLPVYLRPTD